MAMAAPIPRDEPVTSAFFPLESKGVEDQGSLSWWKAELNRVREGL